MIKFITADKYFDELVANIPRAKKRIVIHAMGLMWGSKNEPIVQLLIKAAGRGVEVSLIGDIFSKFQIYKSRFSSPVTDYSWAKNKKINRQLAQNNINVTFLGKLKANPYKGRCHSKITIIDDTTYTFGGVNFTNSSFDNHDYMLKIENPAFANRMYALVQQIKKDKVMKDLREPIAPDTAMLFDGGTPQKSIIYDTACKAVAEAQKVYYLSQMCPSGRLAKLLNATESYCYFNRFSQTRFPDNLGMTVDQHRFKITNLYKGDRYIHAKFILTEDKDGSKHIISGSNNFSWRGVAYGTKEIAIHSTDPILWNAFYRFLQSVTKN